MKLISAVQSQNITLVCCLHGNEVFGLDVFQYFSEHVSLYPDVTLLLAHEEAIQRGVRYIDEDLNRVFGLDQNGSSERMLASEILSILDTNSIILDIHTTTSDIGGMVPIVKKMNTSIQQILNVIKRHCVVHMQSGLGDHALIAQVSRGVSLEFNDAYAAQNEALQEVISIVDALRVGQSVIQPAKEVYVVDGTIPLSTVLPLGTRNFVYCDEIAGYPFLLYEKSYTDIQGFCASLCRSG